MVQGIFVFKNLIQTTFYNFYLTPQLVIKQF